MLGPNSNFTATLNPFLTPKFTSHSEYFETKGKEESIYFNIFPNFS